MKFGIAQHEAIEEIELVTNILPRRRYVTPKSNSIYLYLLLHQGSGNAICISTKKPGPMAK